MDDVDSNITEGTGEASVAIALVAPTVAAIVHTVVSAPSSLEGTKTDGMVLVAVVQDSVAVTVLFVIAADDCLAADGTMLSRMFVCVLLGSCLFVLKVFSGGNDAALAVDVW